MNGINTHSKRNEDINIKFILNSNKGILQRLLVRFQCFERHATNLKKRHSKSKEVENKYVKQQQ